MPSQAGAQDTQLSLKASKYEHTPLDNTKRQIRLLHLHPPLCHVSEGECGNENGDATNAIHCTFSLASLDDNPSYEALSYVWGDPGTNASITVHGHHFPVTSNLVSILKLLRYEDRKRVLWIDALCINQDNVNERSHQVAEMHRIYSQAWKVVAFLGQAWDQCDTAINLLKFVGNNPDLHWNSSVERSVYSCGFDIQSQSLLDSIIRFFSCPWWTRVWTVQEYILAQRVEFMCGSHTLDADELTRFVTYRNRHKESCCWPASLTGTANFEKFVAIFLGAWNFSQLNECKAERHVFLRIVLMFRLRECSDPRDKVYGLLGLTDDTFRASVPVNFDLSTSEVYQEATLAASSKNLDSLSFPHNFPDSDSRPPSWVLDFSEPAKDFDRIFQLVRLEILHNVFRASKDSHGKLAKARYGEAATDAALIDIISDVHCDPILDPHISDSDKRRASVQKCWDMLERWHNPSEPYTSKSDAFWRTLCGGVSDAGPLRKDRYAPLLDTADSTMFENWKQYVCTDEYSSFIGEGHSDAEKVNNVVSIATYRRRFAVLRRGHIGLIPEKARVGDVVVIIPGGNVPYILRPVQHASDANNLASGSSAAHRYELLGDAYIHGIMHGEAWDETRLERIILV